MGCGVTCFKCLLIVTNIIFGVIGLAMAAVGGLVLSGASKYIQPFIDDALDSIPSITGLFDIQNAQTAPPGGVELNIEEILSPVAIFLICIGTFIALASLFGLIGACCSVRLLLIIYAIIVGILFVIQLLMVILFFSGALDSKIEDQMVNTLTENYISIDTYDLYNIGWNFIMLWFDCCGTNDYTDFNDATLWNSVVTFDIGTGVAASYTMTTPFACCKFTGDFPSITPIDLECTTSPNDTISNYNTGCWDAMQDNLNNYFKIAIGVLVAVLLFQLLCVIAAGVIGTQIKNENNKISV